MKTFALLVAIVCGFMVHNTNALYPYVCPNQTGTSAWNQSRCALGQSCAPNGFSVTGWGCAPYPISVSCNPFQVCPGGTECMLLSGSSYNAVYMCYDATKRVNVTSSVCTCKPGVPFPMDPKRKNVIVIGDSISIGYTPVLANNLSDIALVQHAPWDFMDGGAEETAYGAQCINNWFASPSGIPIQPNLIYFNFGMHNLVTSCKLGDGKCVPGQSGNTSVYSAELAIITKKIVKFAIRQPMAAKVVFGITSPYLCDAGLDAIIQNTLNTAAASVMEPYGITTIDLHTAIVNKCGKAPVQSCMGVPQCFCPHCPGAGYEFLGNNVIAPILRKLL
eukprot:PhF_6_TR20540/c0_g1_i3/m.29659